MLTAASSSPLALLDDTTLAAVVGGVSADCGDGDDGEPSDDGQASPFHPYRDPPFPRTLLSFVGDTPRT